MNDQEMLELMKKQNLEPETMRLIMNDTKDLFTKHIDYGTGFAILIKTLIIEGIARQQVELIKEQLKESDENINYLRKAVDGFIGETIVSMMVKTNETTESD